MKTTILSLSMFCLLSANVSVFAQDAISFLEINTEIGILDNNEKTKQLNATDTIPGFDTKPNKLKISGTIYMSDGVTPAKGVILSIEQADENGDFDLRTDANGRYVYNSGSIQTDADGRYAFYTYIPGNDRRYNQMQQLFPTLKEPSKPAYEIASFLFDDDPLLTRLCRKRMAKKGDPTRILKLKKETGLFIVQKDIILQKRAK